MLDSSSDLKIKFQQDLLSKDPEKMVSLWLLEKIPYIFHDDQELFIDWKITLAQKLQVNVASIILVGSSCVGLSLNPYKNYRSFNQSSDIDIAVVSDYYFNEAWRFFRNLGVRIHSLRPKEKQIIDEHVRKYIYWGTIATDHILPLFPFGRKWQQALLEMSQVCPTQGRELKIRLYKDFESLRGYHINNLIDLRSYLLDRKEE